MSRILVIDDDPLFRKLICSCLSSHFQVEAAPTGHEGYRRAVEAPPELLLLDLHMPNWNGVQTLQAWRSDEKLKRIPVVLMTGSPDCREARQVEQIGVKAIYSKSNFSRDSFLSIVCEWIHGVPAMASASC